MEYLLVCALSVLAAAKMSFQSAFGKKSVKNSTDALGFNIYVFVIAAILFLPKVFGCSSALWVFAAVSAIFTIGYQLFYTKALSVGNVSLTVLTVNFSMVINVLVSCFCFGESVSYIRIIAIIITIASFVISNMTSEREPKEKRWLIYTLLAMISHSLSCITQKVFGESAYSGENQAYVSCMYIASAVIGIVIYLVMNKKDKRTFKIDFSLFKHAFMVGITLALYQLIYTYSLAHIDGTFLFPAHTGSLIVFSTVSGVILFKDKFTKKQIIGVFLGLIALVLMNY